MDRKALKEARSKHLAQLSREDLCKLLADDVVIIAQLTALEDLFEPIALKCAVSGMPEVYPILNESRRIFRGAIATTWVKVAVLVANDFLLPESLEGAVVTLMKSQPNARSSETLNPAVMSLLADILHDAEAMRGNTHLQPFTLPDVPTIN